MENTFGNAITISIVGFGLVFVCLTLFALMISILNKTDRRVIAYKKRKAEEAQNTNQSIVADGIEEEIVPVIVAAVYAAFSNRVIFRKITFAKQAEIDSDWSRISRASSVATHNIRRRG